MTVGARAYRSRRYILSSSTPRAPRRFASLYPQELTSPAPFATPQRSWPISPPNPALSTYRMLRHSGGDIRLFRKVVKCTARLREGKREGERRMTAPLAPHCDIGRRIVEFHRGRIPSARDGRYGGIRGTKAPRIPSVCVLDAKCTPFDRPSRANQRFPQRQVD